MCCEQKLQGMDERRIRSLADGYCKFSDIEKKVLPIISKCLEGISAAGTKVNEKQASVKCLSYFFLSGLESSPRKHNFKQNLEMSLLTFSCRVYGLSHLFWVILIKKLNSFISFSHSVFQNTGLSVV